MKILMEFPKPKDPNAADAMPEAERKQVRCCDGAHACACVRSFMPTYLLLLCLCTSSELANNRYPLHPHIPPPKPSFQNLTNQHLPPTSQELSAERAYEILRRISDEDCKALGFDVRFVRPDWMIITNLPVPPPPVRLRGGPCSCLGLVSAAAAGGWLHGCAAVMLGEQLQHHYCNNYNPPTPGAAERDDGQQRALRGRPDAQAD